MNHVSILFIKIIKAHAFLNIWLTSFVHYIKIILDKRYNRGLRDVSVDKVTKLLRNGNAEFNIPNFDPHHIEKFKMNVNEDDLKWAVTLLFFSLIIYN